MQRGVLSGCKGLARLLADLYVSTPSSYARLVDAKKVYSSDSHPIRSLKIVIRGMITVQSGRNITDNPSNGDILLDTFLANMRLDNS